MPHYSEVNPPSVYEDDCPCANSETGYDERCPQESHHEAHRAELATERNIETRCRVHAIRCCTICSPTGLR